MVKRILLMAALFAAMAGAQQAWADVFVHGHYRSNGTYVQPHYQTSPDHTVYNNYSTYPNVNPYTGRVGTHHAGVLARAEFLTYPCATPNPTKPARDRPPCRTNVLHSSHPSPTP